jgi:hypothetical protein
MTEVRYPLRKDERQKTKRSAFAFKDQLPARRPAANLLLQERFIRNTPRRAVALWCQLLGWELPVFFCQWQK